MRIIEIIFYQKHILSILLYPFSLLYRLVIFLRYQCYRFNIKKTWRASVPVIVVGNITVGGTGKTPLVIWLVQWLQSKGLKPGVVSRGYGGQSNEWPQVVNQHSDPYLVGDEPVLIAKRTGVPIVVAPKRVVAAKTLLKEADCNIIVSDDGLAHYALARDIEIVVVDGRRRFGNSFCLPAGPLREPSSRLAKVDAVIVNGGDREKDALCFDLQPDAIYQLINPQHHVQLDYFYGATVFAIAAIGHPTRFFNTLEQLGLQFELNVYPDHYYFKPSDIDYPGTVIMTEKDAVKCQFFADERHWCLTVSVIPNRQMIDTISNLLDSINYEV